MMDKEFVVPVAEGHTMTLDAVVMPPLNNPSRVRLSLGTQLLKKRTERGKNVNVATSLRVPYIPTYYTWGNECAGGGSVTGSPTLREKQRVIEKDQYIGLW